MAEESSGDCVSGDLESAILEAKNKEIEILKNEVIRLQLLLEKKQNVCAACGMELRTSLTTELMTVLENSGTTKENSGTTHCHSVKHVLSCDAETQTFETDFLGLSSSGSAEDWNVQEGSDCTVADLVKEVVEGVSPQSDYVYDENYKMYYSPSTGYYYDIERNLLYDSNSGAYYSYDSQKNTYEFYYQATPGSEMAPDSHDVVGTAVSNLKITCTAQERGSGSPESTQNRKAKQKVKKKTTKFSAVNDNNNNDSAKLKDQDLNSSSAADEEKGDESSLEEEEPGSPYAESTTTEGSYHLSSVSSPASINIDEDSAESWPPCIRLIVEESNRLKIGSLLLITCTGAIVGRDKHNRLCIPDLSVSKIHAEVSYNNETCEYYITDLGSQNGTFIDETRLSQSKEKSAPHVLKHSDHLSFGFCKLLVHIHPGYETCDECEPGQVQAKFNEQSGNCLPVVQTREEKEKERRHLLRQMKKKFGLQAMNYEASSSSSQPTSSNYQDRAKERQQTKGSDNPYEKTAEPASVHVTISSDNKGYQLLKKMGWKEGEALGTKASGETEPVPINVRSSRAGFGSKPAAEGFIQSVPENPRNRKWRKAQKRFSQTE